MKRKIFMIALMFLGLITIVIQGTNVWGCVPEGSTELYKGKVLLVVQTESEVVVKNISDSAVAIRLSWDGKDPGATGKEGSDSYLSSGVKPEKCFTRSVKEHISVQVWSWGSSGELADSSDVPLKKSEDASEPKEKKEAEEKKESKKSEELCKGDVLLVMQTKSDIEVKNVSNDPVAIRISWDEKDPGGSGAKGSDSYLDNWVKPGKLVTRKIKKHKSVQTWAWGNSGTLVDSCSSPVK